jgi:hypothetical protein
MGVSPWNGVCSLPPKPQRGNTICVEHEYEHRFAEYEYEYEGETRVFVSVQWGARTERKRVPVENSVKNTTQKIIAIFVASGWVSVYRQRTRSLSFNTENTKDTEFCSEILRLLCDWRPEPVAYQAALRSCRADSRLRNAA